MENSMKFTLAIDKINKKIADLNIKISKNSEDIEAKEELQKLINDKTVMYRGSAQEFISLIKKYGSNV